MGCHSTHLDQTAGVCVQMCEELVLMAPSCSRNTVSQGDNVKCSTNGTSNRYTLYCMVPVFQEGCNNSYNYYDYKKWLLCET